MAVKIINRILFAFLAALGLIAVYNYTDANIKQDKLTELATAALERNEDTFFIPNQYFNSTPLYENTFTSDTRTISVKLYEVLLIQYASNGDYTVKDGVFFFLKVTGDPLEAFFNLEVSNSSHTTVKYMGFQMLGLNIYSSMNKDNYNTFIDREAFKENDTIYPIVSFKITDYEDDTLILDIPVNLMSSRFTIKSLVDAYVDTNGELPTEPFNTISMNDSIVINTSKWVMINISIYIVVIAILTYLFFVYKKKYLGKKKPTIGVQKDIEKIKEFEDPKNYKIE